jgi:hypothetical protein
MVNPENNGTSVDAVTRPAFGYFLISLSFMFNCHLIMNMFMFNSCLNMNTCKCYVAHTIILLLKYLFDHGIKTCRLISYYLTLAVDQQMFGAAQKLEYLVTRT